LPNLVTDPVSGHTQEERVQETAFEAGGIRSRGMGSITVGQENSTSIDLHYEDHGTGKPVVLIHGYPLSGASWEKQTAALLEAGHRVVTYDRRGFGKSSQPTVGYDYDTLAADLNVLLTRLDLRDAALVGFSMGGGEVARYLGKYGSERVRAAVFISSVPPFLVQANDNPDGVPGSVFEGIKAAAVADRPAFLNSFFHNFYNADVLMGTRISEAVIQADWNIAVAASPIAIRDCIGTWGTDFRADLAGITVPTLVIHGDADRTVPLALSGQRTHESVQGSRLVVIEGGPHGILWTHAEQVNIALLDFLK
jgi:non-heme chloroperoxidase